MRCLVMFITAVCLIFLLKLKWPKNNCVYELVYCCLLRISNGIVAMVIAEIIVQLIIITTEA